MHEPRQVEGEDTLRVTRPAPAQEVWSPEDRERPGPGKGKRVQHLLQDLSRARAGLQNSCTGRRGASSSGECKLQGGPRPPGTWRWGPLEAWEPWVMMAPEEASGLCAMHQCHLVRS